MIKAVLFDLDETLLDLNLDAYVRAFTMQRIRLLARISRKLSVAIAAPWCRTYVGMLSDRDDDLTNAQFLERRFGELSGIPLGDPAIASCLDYYDREFFNPEMAASSAVRGRPRRGGLACLEACERLGVAVALATNPTFPRSCTEERMRWAGVDGYPFACVTSLENSTRTKPWDRYYREVCAAVGAEPHECLMVGNDTKYDFPSRRLGLRTCYVGPGRDERAYWNGTMESLSLALPRLVEPGTSSN